MGPYVGPLVGPLICPAIGPLAGQDVGPDNGPEVGPLVRPKACPDVGPEAMMSVHWLVQMWGQRSVQTQAVGWSASCWTQSGARIWSRCSSACSSRSWTRSWLEVGPMVGPEVGPAVVPEVGPDVLGRYCETSQHPGDSGYSPLPIPPRWWDPPDSWKDSTDVLKYRRSWILTEGV